MRCVPIKLARSTAFLLGYGFVFPRTVVPCAVLVHTWLVKSAIKVENLPPWVDSRLECPLLLETVETRPCRHFIIQTPVKCEAVNLVMDRLC